MSKVKRLYNQFSPTDYKLDIKPDYKTLDFKADVTFKGQYRGTSNKLLLHAKDLQIDSAKLITRVGSIPLKISKPADDQIALISPDQFPDSVEIQLSYRGHISDQLHGIYPTRYKVAGKEIVALATQLESHHAREVFPCIDEPAAKAVFRLSITAPSEYTVISNTPLHSKKKAFGLVKHTFEPTPKMSCYLLAFVSGLFEHLETTTKRGISLRAWATPGKKEQARFALETGSQILDYYEDYFGIEYPLSKCDLIALPDFVSGAMENWGCIVFRETAMLIDDSTSLTGKQRVAIVVAHELAHQWFGNLVTMEWWTDLWLNEGFASWIEYKVIDRLFPEWDMWTEFVVDSVFRGQELDSLSSSHPVEVSINDPDDIRSIFDAISYEKGAALIRMLETFMKPENFREGLQQYLTTYAYDNAMTKHLWQSLEESSGIPVEDFMTTWTSKTGFPYVSFINAKKLEQKPFRLLPKNDSSHTSWPIPLLNGTDQIMRLRRMTYRNNVKTPLNVSRSGFFYTLYSKQQLKRLKRSISENQFGVVDRLGFLHESMELAKAGLLETTEALEFIVPLSDDQHAAVWQTIAGSISDIRRVFDSDDIRQPLQNFTQTIISTQLRRLGLSATSSDSHNDQLVRPIVLGLASFAEEDSVIKMSQRLFTEVLHRKSIDPDLKSVVFTTVARQGGPTDFDRLVTLHQTSESAAERMKLAAAICNFKQKQLHSEALAYVKSKHVRDQDTYYWLAYILSNPYAKESAWRWLKENWQWISDKFASDIATFSYIPKFAARSFSSKDFYDDYQKFFEKAFHKGISRQIEQGGEIILWQTNWQKGKNNILDWLTSQ